MSLSRGALTPAADSARATRPSNRGQGSICRPQIRRADEPLSLGHEIRRGAIQRREMRGEDEALGVTAKSFSMRSTFGSAPKERTPSGGSLIEGPG